MTRSFCLLFAATLLFAACQKELSPDLISTPAATPAPEFVKYVIKKGEQFCDKNNPRAVETSEMKFVVKFDSSAVYQTTDPSNQDDINKLFGFSDNNGTHHAFSARFGWRWSNNALRLFGYIYNNSVLEYKELTTIPIGEEVKCQIRVTPSAYIFTVNSLVQTFPRMSTTTVAKGYQLYPYFGGDELAPHDIRILIKEL